MKRSFQTTSGIDLPDLFVPGDSSSSQEYQNTIGAPGKFPFTRGVYPTMYRGRRWTMRQYAGFGTAKESNKRYRYLLSQGTTGLSVAFDLPTQMGRDSDDPRAEGEVGRVGVAIDSLHDMEVLFDEIPLAEISTSMTINATGNILLALYLELARKRKIPWSSLRGTIQNDILKEYIARGTYIYPPRAALRMVTDVFEFCRDEVPGWNTINVSGYHMREAGSTAVQEVAFTLANGITYLQSAVERGLDIDSFASRVGFFFNCHNNFLEEVAKFRAARRMWARIVRDRFHAKNEASCMLRFHTQTAGSSLLAQQPEVNIVRTTLQALAAVLGGTQSLHTNAYDEALALPTAESALLALRTQQVIACESGVADVVDPLGGSYAVEQLTNEIESRATEYLATIDSLGGMLRAIETGFPQGEIEQAAYKYQQSIESGEQEIVGLNVYREGAGANDVELLKVDPKLERKQIADLKKIRKQRNSKKVLTVLEVLREEAKAERNLMPSICAAVAVYATVGEISAVLRECYGEHGS